MTDLFSGLRKTIISRQESIIPQKNEIDAELQTIVVELGSAYGLIYEKINEKEGEMEIIIDHELMSVIIAFQSFIPVRVSIQLHCRPGSSFEPGNTEGIFTNESANDYFLQFILKREFDQVAKCLRVLSDRMQLTRNFPAWYFPEDAIQNGFEQTGFRVRQLPHCFAVKVLEEMCVKSNYDRFISLQSYISLGKPSPSEKQRIRFIEEDIVTFDLLLIPDTVSIEQAALSHQMQDTPMALIGELYPPIRMGMEDVQILNEIADCDVSQYSGFVDSRKEPDLRVESSKMMDPVIDYHRRAAVALGACAPQKPSEGYVFVQPHHEEDLNERTFITIRPPTIDDDVRIPIATLPPIALNRYTPLVYFLKSRAELSLLQRTLVPSGFGAESGYGKWRIDSNETAVILQINIWKSHAIGFLLSWTLPQINKRIECSVEILAPLLDSIAQNKVAFTVIVNAMLDGIPVSEEINCSMIEMFQSCLISRCLPMTLHHFIKKICVMFTQQE